MKISGVAKDLSDKIKTWGLDIYFNSLLWYITTHSCPNINGELTGPLSKLRDVWLTVYHGCSSCNYLSMACIQGWSTVYSKKYGHGFVVLCFVVVMHSFIMNSHEVFIHIYQGCFAGTGAIVRLPQCQWSKPDGYGKISQCITTTKHSKAKKCAYFLGYTVVQLCLFKSPCLSADLKATFFSQPAMNITLIL